MDRGQQLTDGNRVETDIWFEEIDPVIDAEGAPRTLTTTSPLTARTRRGDGTPTARAASWKSAATLASASDCFSNDSLTAQIPRDVDSLHT